MRPLAVSSARGRRGHPGPRAHHDDARFAVLDRAPLFDGLDDAERAKLAPLLSERRFAPGEVILEEGRRDPAVHVLWEGSAKVVKAAPGAGAQHALRVLSAGEVVGEMSLADDEPSSASVIAEDFVLTWRFDSDALAALADGLSIRAKLLANVSKVLSGRLRANNQRTAEAMHGELVHEKERVSAGVFALTLIAITSIYTLCAAAVHAMDPRSLPRQAFLSPIFIITPCIPIWFLIRRSHHPPSSFGLQLANWPTVVRESIVYTAPLLVLLTALKWLAIVTIPRLRAEPLFNTTAIFEDGRFDLRFYLLAMLLYVAICPMQEFFTRSGLQTALQRFLPRGDDRPNWPAIVVANLVFAQAHLYVGVGLSAAAFVPGLFWGWLFARQRSLLGVSISHALVGVWALQVLGVQSVVGGH